MGTVKPMIPTMKYASDDEVKKMISLNDTTIHYEPYKGTMGGQSITEFVSTSFPDSKTMIHISEIEMPDGSKMKFEFRGHRE